MNFLEEKFDIIIQGGQSNAEGSGMGTVSNDYIPNERVCYLFDKRKIELGDTGLKTDGCSDEPFIVQVAKERAGIDGVLGDFSLIFAEKYMENGVLKPDRKLLIIRAAVGGTGFQKGHWGVHDYLYLRMISMVEYALSWNPKNKVVGFLWHQGEHDAFEGNTPENYHLQLSNMLKDVRKRFGDVPFIAGEFVHDWKSKNFEICIPILTAIRQVVKESDNAAFIETSDLLSNNQKIGNGDDIHFCRESLYELGRRYFDAYSLLRKEKTGEYVKSTNYERLITVGDSITVGTYFTENGGCYISAPNYATRLKELLGAKILENRAISGISYSATSKTMTEFALSKFCGDILGGQIIIVAVGTNDFGTNVVLGNPSDVNDISFYGAVDYCLRTIKANNPVAEILVVLPTPRLNEDRVNEAGLVLEDYRKAIQYKAEKLNLMIIDGSKLQIDPADENDKKNYIYDGVHFNEDGQELIAKFIYSEYCKNK